MIKVITYGTYDLLHYGHIRLLERAKALGDYLIVAVTADDFDKNRGKINVQQSLMERIEGVRATGLADEIIVEEYEGQKIDDVRKYDIDIFTVGSDWVGKFDYMKNYCKVVYLDRTEGISSSDIRSENAKIKLGLVGNSSVVVKFANESKYVNGLEISGIYSENQKVIDKLKIDRYTYKDLLEHSDAVFILSEPKEHYNQILDALKIGKHVICQSPVTLDRKSARRLFEIAKKNNCIFMESIKTAYATAYLRLVLLAKTGKIGHIYSVDAVCTSLDTDNDPEWTSITAWGPTAMLPVFQILGTEYNNERIVSHITDDGKDMFTKISFEYKNAVASIKIGKGVKSEGELIISGTKGYIYVPAPWWKTDYFEIRYENMNDNKKYFYQLDGEGIRYELVAFTKAIEHGKLLSNIDLDTTYKICDIMEDFEWRKNMIEI